LTSLHDIFDVIISKINTDRSLSTNEYIYVRLWVIFFIPLTLKL